MKLWLSNEEPDLKDKNIIWVKNSWECLKSIEDLESKVAEGFRSDLGLDETLDVMEEYNIEYICLDSIPESMKFLEKLVKDNKKFFKFCFCGDKNAHYDRIEKLILKNQFLLDWRILRNFY